MWRESHVQGCAFFCRKTQKIWALLCLLLLKNFDVLFINYLLPHTHLWFPCISNYTVASNRVLSDAYPPIVYLLSFNRIKILWLRFTSLLLGKVMIIYEESFFKNYQCNLVPEIAFLQLTGSQVRGDAPTTWDIRKSRTEKRGLFDCCRTIKF